MAYKLNVVDHSLGVSFNARYENLSRAKKPEIVAKNAKGNIVKLTTVVNGSPVVKGGSQKVWLDDKGNEWSKQDLQFFMGDQQVEELSQTKSIEIEGFSPLKNYTDSYVIATYYELFPDNNSMKKDIDRQRAVRNNTVGMHKLWEYLMKNHVVARGEFCPASRGFIASDGYIRAIEFDGKWGLEIGVFKEEKIFQHLQEGVPDAVAIPEKTKTKRIKLV